MIKSIMLVAAAFLALTATSFAQPVPSRTYDLYVAPLGPSVEGIMNDLKPLLQAAGRTITEVKEIQRINAGKITGLRFTHTGNVPAKWHYQDVYVNVFGNVYNQAWQVIRFQQMANKNPVDIQVIQQIGIGKITGLRVYFAD